MSINPVNNNNFTEVPRLVENTTDRKVHPWGETTSGLISTICTIALLTLGALALFAHLSFPPLLIVGLAAGAIVSAIACKYLSEEPGKTFNRRIDSFLMQGHDLNDNRKILYNTPERKKNLFLERVHEMSSPVVEKYVKEEPDYVVLTNPEVNEVGEVNLKLNISTLPKLPSRTHFYNQTAAAYSDAIATSTTSST